MMGRSWTIAKVIDGSTVIAYGRINCFIKNLIEVVVFSNVIGVSFNRRLLPRPESGTKVQFGSKDGFNFFNSNWVRKD